MTHDLPTSWCLGTISDISYKGVQRKPESGDEFTYIDIGSIDRKLKVIKSPQTILGESAPSRARKVVNTGDVLVSLTRPNLNAVAFVEEKYDMQIASTGFEVIKPLIVEGKFIYYLVRSEKFINSISGAVQGALYPAAKSVDVKNYELLIPPLAEQKAITEKLDSLLAQVEATKTRLEGIPDILKQLRQSVLAAAVSGELTANPSEKTETISWQTKQLKVLCRSISDGDHQAPPKSESGIPFLVISNVVSGKIEFNSVSRWVSEDYYKNIKAIRKPELNDILYTVTGSFGIPVVVESDEPFCFQRHIAIIKPNHDLINAKYLAFYLSSPSTKHHAGKIATGTAQKTVSLTNLRKFQIDFPPIEEQKEIVQRIEELFAFADHIEAKAKTSLASVNHLTQSILAQAFSGELTKDWRQQNPDLISGENSAEALLKRIQTERETLKPVKKTRQKRS